MTDHQRLLCEMAARIAAGIESLTNANGESDVAGRSVTIAKEIIKQVEKEDEIDRF